MQFNLCTFNLFIVIMVVSLTVMKSVMAPVSSYTIVGISVYEIFK